MRFLTFLRLSVKCFDALAWPMLSLGYPVCASIRAIESESNENIQNLVTYWVACSLISLFDHAFAALLERLPLWPYMKLIAVCFLAIPDFRGSFYAYEHIIHPCILAIVEFVTDQSHLCKDFSFQKEDFLAAAERYVAENGSESLEKLISEKAKNTDMNAAAKDISEVNTEKVVDLPKSQREMKAEELKELTEMAAAKCTQVNAIPVEKDGGRPTEVQEQEQKVWACALCHVTTHSELDLKAHYHGQKHKSKQAELKRMKQNQSKAKGSAASNRKNSPPNATPKENAAAPNQKFSTGQRQDEIPKISKSNVKSQNYSKRNSKDVKQSQHWCSICGIKCPGEISMACHLKGKKHLARIEELASSG